MQQGLRASQNGKVMAAPTAISGSKNRSPCSLTISWYCIGYLLHFNLCLEAKVVLGYHLACIIFAGKCIN
jgi:hypothetical protein